MFTALLLTVCAAAPMEGELIFPIQELHVHGSSIVELPNGDLLATWFHGSGERSKDDVKIQGARRKKGATEWSPVFLMADTPNVPDCNPALFLDKNDKLWLFWIVVTQNRWERCILKYKTSTDYNGDGVPNWDWQDIIILKPDDDFSKDLEAGFEALNYSQSMWAEYALPYNEVLVEAAKDPTKTDEGWMTRITPITLKSGRIVLPLYHDGFNISLAGLSDDGGETWTASKPIVGLGPIQPAIIERTNGELVAYMRDSGVAPRATMTSTSKDGGMTWTPAVDIEDIPNPGGSVAAMGHSNGQWIMLTNDIPGSREQLSLLLSEDEGKTWPHRRIVEVNKGDGARSFAYPNLYEGADGRVHGIYSYAHDDGKSIKHIVFDTDWIKEK